MEVIRKIVNRRFTYLYLFLFFMLLYFYLYNRDGEIEIAYAILYFSMGLLIALFYIFKDMILNPDKLNYKEVLMEKPLYNPKGEILEEFESFPLYREFIAMHLERNDEDPYGAEVTSLQAIRYRNNLMIDSLFIPLKPKDPLLKRYALSLKEATGKLLKFADNTPIIVYNQPFTHTYLNIKLDKEVHITFIDAMRMSKDIYGIFNEPIKEVQRYLRLVNIDDDKVRDARVVGAIYLDYIHTVTVYKEKEKRKKKCEQRKAQRKKAQSTRSLPEAEDVPKESSVIPNAEALPSAGDGSEEPSRIAPSEALPPTDDAPKDTP